MAATPRNKCWLLNTDGTPCYESNADCPHRTIDAVLASLQETNHGTVTNGTTAPAVFPVPLPPGFPAAPAEACATIMVCGHEIEIVLRDVDEARLMARMGGLIQSYCEGEEEHEEDGEDDVN